VAVVIPSEVEESRNVILKVAQRDPSTVLGMTMLLRRHSSPDCKFQMTKSLAHQFAEYTCALRFEDLSRETVNEVKRRVIDSIGCDAITATALAYEVQCRLCDAASIRARGWDHVTYGAFSTALASAKLMQLDREKTRHAVNIAGVACAAMRQARVGELSHWKGVAFANAARHGVYSAVLARAGMTGPAPIFEGQMGFEKELGVSLGNVGEKFAVPFLENPQGPASMILNTSIKYWPAEYHSQSAIEAALFLREQIGDVSQVASVNIESHDASVDI